jgi:hypothetical protein
MKEKITWHKAVFVGSLAGTLYFLTASVMDYFNHAAVAWLENIVSSIVFMVLVVFIWRHKPRFKEKIKKRGWQW